MDISHVACSARAKLNFRGADTALYHMPWRDKAWYRQQSMKGGSKSGDAAALAT